MNITVKPSSLLATIAATNHSGRIGIVGQNRCLTIYAGDGYRMMAVEADGCTVDGDFLTWIEAGPLESALKASTDAEVCEIMADQHAVSYKCGRVSMKTPVSVTAQDFDYIPEPDDSAKSVVVSGTVLHGAVELARSIPRRVEGSDDWRNCVGIMASDFGCDIAATDGMRIAYISITPVAPPQSTFSSAVPPRLLQGLPKMDCDVTVMVWGAWVGFYGDKTSLVVRQLERDFPKVVTESIGKMRTAVGVQKFGRPSLLAAARSLTSLCEDHDSATLETSPGACSLSMTTTSGDITLPIEGEFALDKSVRIPPSQLVPLLSRLEASHIDVGIGDAITPVVMSSVGSDAAYTFVIAPCRK